MRKSTLFISAVLTTFVMAMLAGVASAYQNAIEKTAEQSFPQIQAQPQEQPQVKAVSNALPAESFNISPEEAAGLAAQVLGREDLYSVEVTALDGEKVFMVTFSSGDLVYVSLDGQIRSIGKVQVSTVVVKKKDKGDGGSNVQASTSNQSQEKHEDHEDHEEDHEEDHDDD